MSLQVPRGARLMLGAFTVLTFAVMGLLFYPEQPILTVVLLLMSLFRLIVLVRQAASRR